MFKKHFIREQKYPYSFCVRCYWSHLKKSKKKASKETFKIHMSIY